MLLGFFVADPLYRFGGLASTTPGLFAGAATIDPNAGFVDQALTARAMEMIFSGHLPWWNSLEGLGAPLAGEMQSSALFPLAPLVLLPNGNLLLEIVLSIVSGVGMLLLLRRLGLQPWPVLVGAITFQMCGTFSWLSGAWTYSIPWLPLLVYGIETARARGRVGVRGAAIVGACVAMLIYAGFIETSYLEGLVAVGWAIARLPRESLRVRFDYAARLLLGGAIGLALAAPLLLALVQTLAISYLGGHDDSATPYNLPPPTLLQKLMPYVYGPIFASHFAGVNAIWGGIGGYVGFLPVVLGIAGLLGRRFASVRVLCAIVCALGFAAMLGGPLMHVLLLIPGVKYTAYYRYIDPAIAFALSVLASIAIDDMLVSRDTGGRVLSALLIALGITALGFIRAAGPLAAAAVDGDLAGWPIFSRWMVIVLCAAVCVSLFSRNATLRATIVGIAACTEAAIFLVIPTFSYPASATIALGGIHYLQQHQGLDRVYSLGPLQPNYGSYFGIAYLNYNDLPIPLQTVKYVKAHLDATADPIIYIPNRNRTPEDQRANFAQNIDAFERVGVKYVLTGPGDPIPAPAATRRFRDTTMAIYEMPRPAPYFSAAGCAIVAASRNALDASCPRAATLCRLELNAPGWSADVDGASVPTGTCGEVFQSVSLPHGASHVVFRYAPPQLPFALGLAALGVVVLCVLVVFAIRREPERVAT